MRTTRWAYDLCRFSAPPTPPTPPVPPTPPTPPTPPNPADPPAPPTPPADPAPDALATAQAEIEKWRALSQQNEARAKANADKAKQFDELQAAGQTELEKAQARAEAAEKAQAETLANSVASEVRAAADAFHDRSDAVNELTLQEGGLQRFVTDGRIDRDAINAAVADVLARKAHLKKGDAPPPPPPPQDPGLGPRGGGNTVDYRNVDKQEFNSELAKYGLRPRST